jgi:hypothetical protein
MEKGRERREVSQQSIRDFMEFSSCAGPKHRKVQEWSECSDCQQPRDVTSRFFNTRTRVAQLKGAGMAHYTRTILEAFLPGSCSPVDRELQ